jgi:hypothetical protein
LCCLEIELPTANQLIKLAFETVFKVGVPRRGSDAGQRFLIELEPPSSSEIM